MHKRSLWPLPILLALIELVLLLRCLGLVIWRCLDSGADTTTIASGAGSGA